MVSALIAFIITALVTAVALLIIARVLPFLGVEIDSVGKAVIAGLVFGVLNAFLRPILTLFGLLNILNWLTLGLFALVVNVIIFGLAALLVQGFRLRKGFISAILGAIALSILLSILDRLLITLGLVTVG